MNRFLSLALIGLLTASCAHRPDTRIADFTREYVAGRISCQRYHDLCQVVYAETHRYYPPAQATSSDNSSASDTTTNDDKADKKKHEQCKNEQHPGQPCPHPSGRN